MTPLLAINGLTKRYGGYIGCEDVTFDLFPGEVVGAGGNVVERLMAVGERHYGDIRA